MSYQPPKQYAELRSIATLEDRLKARDVNGSELARQADVPRVTISRLRRERTKRTLVDHARAIERALKVKRGTLFDYDPPQPAKPATAKPAAKRAA